MGVSTNTRRTGRIGDHHRRLDQLTQAGIDPAPERAASAWAEFLRSPAHALLARDFFTIHRLSGSPMYVFAVTEHTHRRIRILGATAVGLRETTVSRKHALERTESTVRVGDQPIRIKTAWLDGHPVNVNPEWRDVAAAAETLSRPAKDVLAEARRAAFRQSPRNDL